MKKHKVVRQVWLLLLLLAASIIIKCSPNVFQRGKDTAEATTQNSEVNALKGILFSVEGKVAEDSGYGIERVLVELQRKGKRSYVYTDSSGNFSFDSVSWSDTLIIWDKKQERYTHLPINNNKLWFIAIFNSRERETPPYIFGRGEEGKYRVLALEAPPATPGVLHVTVSLFKPEEIVLVEPEKPKSLYPGSRGAKDDDVDDVAVGNNSSSPGYTEEPVGNSYEHPAQTTEGSLSTPRQPTTQPVPDKEEDKHAAVTNLLEGNMSYYVPDSMEVKKPGKVSLLISKNLLISDLRGALKEAIVYESNLDTTQIVSARIEISKIMVATLYAMDDSAFRISRIGRDEQYVHLNDSDTIETKWEWSVIPLKPGQHNIVIKVSAKIFDGNLEEWIDRDVYNGVVPVKAIPIVVAESELSLAELIIALWKDNWNWILPTLGAIGGFMAWVKSNFWKKEEPEKKIV